MPAAAAELTAKGYQLIHEAHTEPWGQITARLLSPEGLLVAVCYTPSFHESHEACNVRRRQPGPIRRSICSRCQSEALAYAVPTGPSERLRP